MIIDSVKMNSIKDNSCRRYDLRSNYKKLFDKIRFGYNKFITSGKSMLNETTFLERCFSHNNVTKLLYYEH